MMGFINLKNKFLYFILFTLYFSNVQGVSIEKNDEAYASMLLYKASKEIEKDLGINCVGTGSSMPDKIEKITLFFESCNYASIEKARELEIRATEKLLSIFNMNEQIKPFLKEYPFTPKQAHIMISFRGKNSDQIALVYQSRDRIFYEKKCHSDEKYETFFEESYEEALKIVQKRI